MFEHGARLFEGDPWEPLYEIGYLCAVFEVLEQRRNRDPGATADPSAAEALRFPLNFVRQESNMEQVEASPSRREP